MKLNAQKQNDLIDLYLINGKNEYSLPESEEEIAEYVKIAADNKVSSFLYLQMKRKNLSVKPPLLAELGSVYQKIREKNVMRLKAGLPVLIDMKKNGIDVIILKGNAIADDVYGDIGYKPMNDIDILIKKCDVEKTYDLFIKHNLLSAAALDEDIKKQQKISHHFPPFFDRGLNVFFGTHWDIANPLRGIKTPLEKFWQEKEEMQLAGETFFRLKPLHFLFHLCIHLNAAKTGLREVADIANVISWREKELNAHEFLALAKEASAEKEIYAAFVMTDTLRHFAFVKKVLDELEKVCPVEFKQEAKRRVTPRFKILHIRTNHVSKIEKTFALFMLTEKPLEKTFLLAKMWKLYLLVSPKTALKLQYEMPEANMLKKISATLKAPWRISQVFIADLGLLIFVVVTLRHQWVLAKSYVEFFLKKIKGEKVMGLDDHAAKLGLTFDEIKEISALD